MAKPCHSAPDNLNNESYQQLREETYQKWLKCKKEEQQRKREQEKREKARLLEQDQMKKEASDLSYLLWKHSKDQQKKGNIVCFVGQLNMCSFNSFKLKIQPSLLVVVDTTSK